MEVHEDQKYIKALCSNDFVLIKEIYDKCSSNCRAYVLKNNGNVHDARDVFQEALIEVYQKCKDLKLITSICGYLNVIYRRKWITRLNRRKNLLRILKDVGYIRKGANPAEVTAIDEQLDEIMIECFNKLGENCQNILNMRYKDGIKGDEIADKLNIKPNAVYQRMSDCRKKLKTCFEQHPDYKKLIR